MKKTKISVALAGLMIASAVIVSSCKKKETTTTPPAQDTNASSASDNNMAEQSSNDVENIGAMSVDNGSLSTFRLSGGGLVSPLSGTATVTGFGTGVITVTFSSFVGMDGHTRNGTIVYSITHAGAYYRDSAMVITVATSTVSPYTVDGNTLTISKQITNNGRVAGGNMQWSITSNLTINKASGGTFTWVANRTHVLLNTNATTYDGTSYAAAYTGTANPITWVNTATATPNGAIIQVNGTASGTSADGVGYTVTMSNVVRNMNCSPVSTRPHFHPFVAGTITFTPSGKTARIINFGTGACDATYTISIGSWSETLNW
ncbi:MAG: hypothetical protein ACYDCN_11565 [Bacteroidia bacterium]